MRALLIEPDDATRETLTARLGQLGYEVEAYPDPHSCVRVLLDDATPRDLLVTGLCLPWVTGAAAMGIVRARLGQISLPVIGVAPVDTDDDQAQRIKDAGGEVIRRSGTLYDLVAAVLRVAPKGRANPQTTRTPDATRAGLTQDGAWLRILTPTLTST